MAGPPSREQALPLLAAANNHGDLAVKLSSLKQAKDILLSIEPSQAAELFPYLVELHYAPEFLVRKYLLEVIDEIGVRTREHLSILLPVLLTYLKDNNPVVAKQSIVIGTKFFCIVLEELAFQFQRRGIVERWLEELWTWMLKFRDAVLGIIFETTSIGPKLLAIKFLETYVLQFTLDSNDPGPYDPEVAMRSGKMFNVSWIVDGHPLLDPPSLISDANSYLGILLDMLRPASNIPGSLTIAAVNSERSCGDEFIGDPRLHRHQRLATLMPLVVEFCSSPKLLPAAQASRRLGENNLAAIARKRPVYYKSVLTVLLDFGPNLETAKGRHTVSIQYSLRSALLGFLRCTHPIIAESRERLIKELRAMNAGDAADQVIRQRDKMIRINDRVSRDLQFNREEQLSSQLHISGDITKKRLAPSDNDDQVNSFDSTSKRYRAGPLNNTTTIGDNNGAGHVNGISPKLPEDLSPVEQMIAMIGALIAEGERGVESLEILISNIHADLLADIVITNMKHLPKDPLPFTKYSNTSVNHRSDSSNDPVQVGASNGFATSAETVDLSAQVPASSSNIAGLPFPDMSTSITPSMDSKRDPRRDPRRLDPRRVAVPVDVPPPTSTVEDSVISVQNVALQSNFKSSSPTLPSVLPPLQSISESASQLSVPATQTEIVPSVSPVPEVELSGQIHELSNVEADDVLASERETNNTMHFSPLPVNIVEDIVAPASVDIAVLDEVYSSSSQEGDQLSPDISNTETTEGLSVELPVLPQYIDLTVDDQRSLRKGALERIFALYQNFQKEDFKETQIALVARLFAQIDVNDVIGMVEKRIGHELILHILYHLRSLVISDPVSSAAAVYEEFLLRVAKSLLSDLPASDKSFSRLLGEVPCIPDCVLGLLHDICTRRHSGKDSRDGDRVTQGLGAVWSLILGRPLYRQACLDIALKCTINQEDDVRAKAIRLVSNKLYVVSDISEKIEQYATDMFLSAVDQRFTDAFSPSVESEKRIGEVQNAETSISGSQVSETGISDNDSVRGDPNASVTDSTNIFSQAQSLISLFFALCTKKPTLLHLVFDTYARASRAVKQAVHRHMAVLVRALGSSYSELLLIISNPPNGSEDLLIQVIQLLCEGQTPPPDLVMTVKQLYETKLKDAAILIPILSAFSKDEVLPIFPQLVQLPLQKFQMALAHILQGSAHTGPALTPAEVLVAIHDISPDKDGLPIKKVDFVMEILSRLVNRQVWRVPQLWVGFLKCISQTQPRSIPVLLQLPTPQLEGALNKYPNLRARLTAYANQSDVKASLPRSTLALLGLASETDAQQTNVTSSLHASKQSPSVRSATST
ncbi:HEAT repeat-containing protein [Striga asiatica]|uniref:HEAT repeat-containing protein n=1 Tax=Striga asiatica TaxID=4170 RepID=A0A5A7Q5A6_STRAF|nr:HEAT repeat-containing protein [Striga asiatica]